MPASPSRCLFALAAVAALARPATADDETTKNEARALQREGARLLERGDAAAALPLFRSVYAKYASAKILVNVGSALKALGKDAEAANTYARYLVAADADPARKAEITALLAKLDRGLGRVEVVVEPADAELRLGDQDWQPAGALASWRVTPGEVTLVARKAGLVDAEAKVTVAVGAVAHARLVLSPPAAHADEPTTTTTTGDAPGEDATVTSRPTVARRGPLGASARVIVDGKGRGAGGAVGLVVGLGARLELHAGALVGPTYGVYGGASLHLASGRWRPIVAAGVPVFFDDGARVGVRGAAGLEWRATRRLSVLAELGAEYMIRRADDIDPWVLAPALAAEARL